MKIYVYAICKNEEKFVDRFMDSANESDGVFVVDTGSTDKTIDKLQKRGATVVQKIISPFRFDVARNLSLEMVPKDADLCVCFDLDEYFLSGWRKKLEQIYTKNIHRLRYVYHWQVDANGVPKVSFFYEKIHSRFGYKWIYPVHEVLEFSLGEENYLTTKDVVLIHSPDTQKSRASYLPLLELSVKEHPESDRNTHYLAREYLYHGNLNKALKYFKRHILMKNAVWADEKSTSFRFCGRIYAMKKDYVSARLYYSQATKIAPHLREPFVEFALFESGLGNYKDVIFLVENALSITEHPMTYINESFCFDQTPFDLLSVAYYYVGDKQNALKNVDIALNFLPNDSRILQNRKLILNM